MYFSAPTTLFKEQLVMRMIMTEDFPYEEGYYATANGMICPIERKDENTVCFEIPVKLTECTTMYDIYIRDANGNYLEGVCGVRYGMYTYIYSLLNLLNPNPNREPEPQEVQDYVKAIYYLAECGKKVF